MPQSRLSSFIGRTVPRITGFMRSILHRKEPTPPPPLRSKFIQEAKKKPTSGLLT